MLEKAEAYIQRVTHGFPLLPDQIAWLVKETISRDIKVSNESHSKEVERLKSEMGHIRQKLTETEAKLITLRTRVKEAAVLLDRGSRL